MTSDRPTVVIVGAGFAGLYAAKTLRDTPVQVLLIDQHNYHTFQPLLYQVATAQLEAEEVSRTARGIFRGQDNLRFRQGTVSGVDWDSREVLLLNQERVPFDYLILGVGAIYNDFGTPGVREHGFFLKSLSEAVNIRSHLLRQFERTAADPSLIERGSLTFTIVGGGPTGVEMAGAMSELFRRVLPKDFPELDLGRARIVLLEMADSLLLPYRPGLQRYAQRVLENRGVEVRLGTAVKEVTADAAILADGERLPTQTLIWAAGVRSHPLVESLGVELTRGFRVVCEGNLSIPNHPYAFVTGDASAATDPDEMPYPQVAQTAIQQGRHAAREVLRHLNGEEPQRFRYSDPGNMAIIGRNAGVAQLSRKFLGLRLSGFLGWLGWLFIHLIYLPGHQNRFNALMTWAYSYFTYERHARLIADMVPSPGEIANRTLRLVDDRELLDSREEDVEVVGTSRE